MSLHRSYEPAGRTCTGGPTPGARAVMAHWLGAHDDDGAVNSGIYNCRNVRGSSTTRSLHGEGRAADLGVRPYGATYGDRYAEALRLHSGALGVQLIIWERRVWSAAKADQGWQPYRGVSPHEDHLHVELSRDAAQDLTAEQVERVLGGAPIIPRDRTSSRPVLRLGATGQDVRDVQARLKAAYPAYAGHLGVDGKYGPQTEKVIREFQRRARLTVDGVVGPATYTALGL